MLIQTYITVADIEDLRNRRLELLESQIKVTELYLGNLRKRLVMLQERKRRRTSRTTRARTRRGFRKNLALDISRTASSINNYEKTLSKTRSDQTSLRASFNDDIAPLPSAEGRLA